MSALDLSRVEPGFSDPVHGSQRSFRALMDAMARPGRIQSLEAGPDVAPDGLDQAAAAIALTLFDMDTPVWLAPALRGGAAETFLRFHCGCPITEDPKEAAFALAAAQAINVRLLDFQAGSEKYPDRSTTLALMCPSLSGGRRLSLSGPGVKGECEINPAGLAPLFVSDWAETQSRFQCGVDVFLTSGRQAVGLPRTLSIKEARS
jgi:alpha-D-ribose 1-methylphosphonate 5-triphosphate synthase subunit PhnH